MVFLNPVSSELSGNFFNIYRAGRGCPNASAIQAYLGLKKIKIASVTAGNEFDTLRLVRGSRIVSVRYDGSQNGGMIAASFEGVAYVPVSAPANLHFEGTFEGLNFYFYGTPKECDIVVKKITPDKPKGLFVRGYTIKATDKGWQVEGRRLTQTDIAAIAAAFPEIAPPNP